MSTDTVPAGEPRFDLADRMRKALRESGVSALEMADYLGVSRNTVSNWINGHARPSTAAVRLWAMRTGIPFDWLTTGMSSANGGGPSHSVKPKAPYLRDVSTIRNDRERLTVFPSHAALVA